ncbi:hypothetical protein glysoja_012809 [Glycine soja]|nr:hypothetical protein glysoja_012809 [Glycine soja]
MADKVVTIRTKKFMTNRLLSKKQFICFSCFNGLDTKVEKLRKQMKERKNMTKLLYMSYKLL